MTLKNTESKNEIQKFYTKLQLKIFKSTKHSELF